MVPLALVLLVVVALLVVVWALRSGSCAGTADAAQRPEVSQERADAGTPATMFGVMWLSSL
jgi:hypothetical protein